MSYNGSGTFLINTAGQPVVSGTVISSTAFNSLTADLATGLSTAITKDGQTTVTANIPMSTYKFTGLGVGSAATDSANLSQVQSTVTKLLNSVSGADTITAAASPTLAAYATGQMFYFVAAGDNTTSVTLNIDSLGAKAVTRDGSVALAAADIKSGEVVVVVYDGTRFQVVSQLNSAGDARFANVSIASSLYVGGVSTFVGNAGFSANVSIASALSVGGVAAITGATTIGGNLTLSGGTANGVLYLNGSKVATSGSALTFDGTDLATSGGVRLNNAQYYYGKNAAGSAVRLLGVNAGNVNYVGSIDSGPTEVNYGAASTITAQYWNISGSESMRLTSTGLGIGTASPAYKLNVSGSGYIFGLTGGGATRVAQTFGNTGGGFDIGIEGSAGGTVFTGASAYASVLGSNNATALQFATNGTVRATIDTSGNLGLGVTPSASTIAQFEGGANLILTGRGNSYFGNNVTYNGGWKYIATAVAAQYNISGAEHRWYNAASGTAGNTISWTQAMTLDASGNLGIGTTSPTSRFHASGGAANTEIATVQSTQASTPLGQFVYFSAAAPNNATQWFIKCQDNAAERATIRSNGGLANYQANDVNLSDERTKKDIKPLGSMWDKFKAIEIVSFKYNDQTHNDDNIGVIAQQIEKVAPEFVDADGFGETPEDGVPLKTIYTADMYHAAIKALQEAMSRIEQLEAKVAALENK